MKEETDFKVLEDYAFILKQFSQEYAKISSEIGAMIKRIPFKLDTYDLAYIMQENLKEIHDTQLVIEEYASAVEQLKRNLQTCPPLIDIIVKIDIKAWWDQAYPIIEQIATVTGAITGIAAITVTPHAFIKWVRNKLQEKKKKRRIYMDKLYS